MSKQVLLSANVGVRYGGVKHSLGQQFYADADTAERFVKTGQASVVTSAETKALEASAAADAAAAPVAAKK